MENVGWRTLFSMASTKNITWEGSDHSPIILYIRGIMKEGSHDRREEFRFEARWI